MKQFIIIFGLFLINTNIYAQFGPSQLITPISNNRHILLEDLDGDGDLDLLTSSFWDNELSWYENINGMGNFGPQISIDSNIIRIHSIHVADLDGDGDNDILSGSADTSGDNGTVSWYKNIDGQGNFELMEVLYSNGIAPMIVHSCDLDNDGDIDVLASGYFTGTRIAIFENSDGQGNFETPRPISSDYAQISSIYTSDIDGDNDFDVIASSTNGGLDLEKVIWFENDGNGYFSSENIISTDVGFSPGSVIAKDLNYDGTIDVLYSTDQNTIVWQSNIDGLGSFGAQQIITTEVGSFKIDVGDIDQDGYVDVISSCRTDGKIAWYKNIDGSGNFGQQEVIDIITLPNAVLVKDVNNNGVLDIIVSTYPNISWYENLTPLSVNESDQSLFSIYPIPTTNTISVEPKSKVSKILIFNSSGTLVVKVLNQNILDISELSSGIYYLIIFDYSNNLTTKKIIKE
jgi:hypothetical protein